MPSTTSPAHEILPPRRRVYFSEIGASVSGPLWLRARAALVGLGCPSVWAQRKGPQPRYSGDVGAYGEEVFEHLSECGWTADQIATAGVEVWVAWVATVRGPTDAEVKAEADFTEAGGAPPSGSTGASS